MNDKAMYIFETQLKGLINNCGLTVGEAYYILRLATAELEQIYMRIINQENSQTTTTETIGTTPDENTDESID
jgi:hypothetical protein